MSVDVWEPEKKEPESQEIEIALLERMAALDESSLGSSLEEAGLGQASWLMSLDAAAWQIAESLNDETLIKLVRLFTLLEMQVSGWDAGKKSPVIPLVKILRKREAFSADLRKWVKTNTDNRYLPNGSAL